MKCNRCGSENIKSEVVEFSNGTKHEKITCVMCDTFIKWRHNETLNPTDTKNKISFGKYKDKSFSEVAKVDPDYAKWVIDNLPSKHAKRHLLKALEEVENKETLDKRV